MTIDAIFINYFHPSMQYNKVSTLLDLVSHLTFKNLDDNLLIEFEKENVHDDCSTKICDFWFRN